MVTTTLTPAELSAIKLAKYTEVSKALLAAASYREHHPREFLPEWYKWQTDGLYAHESHVLTMCGNQCISPWTKVETVDGLIPIVELIEVQEFDVHSWDGESRCVRQASGVFLKGIEPMFRFQMDNGQVFDCTRTHQVLTQFGYLHIDQLVFLLSGQHWNDIASDYPASCGVCGCQCDQSLHLPEGTDPGQLPLTGDAPTLDHLDGLQTGEVVRECQRNQTLQELSHLSTQDDLRQHVALFERLSDPTAYIGSQSSEGVRLTYPLQPVELSHRLQLIGVEDYDQDQLLQACDNPLVGTGNRIISIVPIGMQPVLDFTVANTHCYYAAGVIHHNCGKTYSGSYHNALDLTGRYPADWAGFEFDHAIDMTVLGVDNTSLIDVLQREMFGTIDPKTNLFTGGWVHADEISHFDRSQAAGLAKNVYVHGKYGLSKCSLRAYTQSKTGSGSLPLAGTIKDVIHVDECPPDTLVGQLYMRTMNGNQGKGGRVRFTLTPELGLTNLIEHYTQDLQPGQKMIGPVSWDDCAHLTPEKQTQILAGLPSHEHDMRRKGIPFFGSGLIYPIAEDRIKVDPFEIPEHFFVIRAIDLGINHPQATVWLAHDRDQDIVYLVRDYSVSGANAATHASACNAMWPESVCVTPHDYDTTEKGGGETVSKHYVTAGLKHTMQFHNHDGSIFVEPGILNLKDRMETGKFKVFSTCEHFFKEKRMYHRKDGKRVSLNDDVLDACRQGTIMIERHGRQLSKRRTRPRVNKTISNRRR